MGLMDNAKDKAQDAKDKMTDTNLSEQTQEEMDRLRMRREQQDQQDMPE